MKEFPDGAVTIDFVLKIKYVNHRMLKFYLITDWFNIIFLTYP